MQNELSENTKAMLMLTHYFNRSDRSACKPLTDNGFGYLAHWMAANQFQPQDLLDNDRLESFFVEFGDEATHFASKNALSGSMRGLDKTVLEMTKERFQSLLSRGMALSQALEKWQSAGIWIISRADKTYPVQIKYGLREKAPAILFGTGNIDLLNFKGVGFVGSRNCGATDESATITYVDDINQHGLQVVSGAAKGVDSIAMHRSMSNGSNSIGILGDSLFKACGDSQWRSYLKSGQLLLLSPFDPEASFGRGQNAMQRNKYIYFLSEAVVAVCSGLEGGTFNGVKENLIANWCPQYISRHDSPNLAGNEEILNGFPSSKTKVKVLTQANSITPMDSLSSALGVVGETESNSTDTAINIKLDDDSPTPNTTSLSEEELALSASEGLQESSHNDDANSMANIHPAFCGSETLAFFYFDLLDLFRAKQTNDASHASLSEADILKGLHVLVDIIGKAAVTKLVSHFQSHELLIRPGRAKIYQIVDIEK
ncbi:DNA-processing protein DprA [Vibrio sp. B1Z05]|uniref:DNA-processing protein DprA n=1 Tax=Vibrio sp. B1Z05 TaxID=2654980 RepID=UPI0020A6248C|nr:DNA-processing protein DprA [Vibrio sp. B1Z05]